MGLHQLLASGGSGSDSNSGDGNLGSTKDHHAAARPEDVRIDKGGVGEALERATPLGGAEGEEGGGPPLGRRFFLLKSR